MNTLKFVNRNLNIKNNQLREINYIPGSIYGSSINSKAIMATKKELIDASTQPGEVYKVVMNKNRSVFVKIQNIQRDPLTHEPIHFSLVQLPKGEVCEVEVPLELSGTPQGVKNGGVLLALKDKVNIVGLPKNIPEKIETNIKEMKVGDKLLIDDLKLKKNVEFSEDKEEILAVCKFPSSTMTSVQNLEENKLEPDDHLSAM